MPVEKGTESAWPAFMQDEDFDWADEVMQAASTPTEMESSAESLSSLLESETCSIKTTSTEDTDIDDDLFENELFFIEDLDSLINDTDTELPSITKYFIESSATHALDPLIEPLINILETGTFRDTETIANNGESENKPTKVEISTLTHHEDPAKNSKGSKEETPTPIAEPIFVDDKPFTTSSDNTYDDVRDFSVALEYYLTTTPRANLPHHCMNIDLTDEPVGEPIPRRSFGVREKKMFRYRDRILTMGDTNISTIGFKQWMDLKEEGIQVEETAVTESEKKLMRDRRLGYYRCRPSLLRRCWAFSETS